jgi:hypothetical protein
MKQRKSKVNEHEVKVLVDDEGLECPVKYIDKKVLARHLVVENVLSKVAKAQAELMTLKKELFCEVKGYLDSVASEYGEDWKGNARLLNFDKTKEIEMSIYRSIRFDERLNIAKSKIDDCLKRWSGSATAELKMIVLRAFNVDKKGNVDVRQILGLKQFRFEDPVWQEAMNIIDESITMTNSKEYLIFSSRDNPRGQFKSISLNFSNLEVV